MFTVQEYLMVNNMTQTELSKITGVPLNSISAHINKDKGFSECNTKKLEKLGIRVIEKGETFTEIDGFELFKSSLLYQISSERAGTIHCWNDYQCELAINKLEEKRISHYAFYKDGLWTIKYDKSEEYMDW